ncbi:hypothetical protein GCM10010326_66900 [Streptomyces xanthochromogenes]|uniref:WXG100 family type VII secretion target n=2 Tax=Streptomyces xanthochromogenes TaxID=67384 RepID=A0ABQ3ANG1_9ACTN|nr:hypothetical protein GCM10010326_66900 [Streptomyces xanthochromogenes]
MAWGGALMSGAGAAVMATDLSKGLEALTTFKKRVDKLLTEFDGSHGSATNLAAHRISRASFSAAGAAFPEADGLFTQYHRVHERLTSLSRSLSHQIEAMGIAVHGADVGFDNLDEETRQRFWEIQSKTDYDAGLARREKDGKPLPERTDDKTSGTGW